MEKICIIEDDDYKIRDLKLALSDFFPSAEIVCAHSYREGAVLLKNEWDLVLLDMQLPLFREGASDRTYAFGGERLLRALERSGRTQKVIVVTQYTTFSEHLDEVDFNGLVNRLEGRCPTVFRGAIQYAIGQSDWKTELSKLVTKIKNEAASC